MASVVLVIEKAIDMVPMPIFLLLVIFPPQIWSIRVAELAMDGHHTIEPYLNHTLGIGPKNLTDFTVCLRFNVNFLKPTVNAVLSYSTFLSDNALNFDLYRPSSGGLELFACKYQKSKMKQVAVLFFNLGALKSILYFHVIGVWSVLD